MCELNNMLINKPGFEEKTHKRIQKVYRVK